MTPFDSWYSTHIAPTLPNDAPPEVLKLARESMAACWNAALESIATADWRVDFTIPVKGGPEMIAAQCLKGTSDALRSVIRSARVTP